MTTISLKKYLFSGLLSGIISSVLAVLVYIILSPVFNYEIVWVGSDMSMLYIVPIIFATLIANLIGACIVYALAKRTNRYIAIFAVLALIIAILNSVFAQGTLVEEYRVISHILHFLIAILSAILIPKLVKKG